jgi:glycosyltransferase involved in cell wall biosynthesis
MDRKVILLVITNLNFGGAQRVFYNLSVELSRKYKVVECVFNFDAGHAFKTGNDVLSLDVKAGKGFFGKIYNFYLRCKRLKEIKEKVKADICISHLEGADYVNILSRGKEKVICCIHGSKLHDENIEGFVGWIRKVILIPFLYKRANILVTVSKGVSDELIRHFQMDKEKVQWIPNFFYPDLIRLKASDSLPEELTSIFSDPRPTFITVGRLTRQKNQDAFVRLAAAFVKSVKSKWILVGEGEWYDELYSLAKRQPLRVYSYKEPVTNSSDFDIYFLGFYENPYALVSRSDWFVLTSSWEGFPMVIGEAMACGTPVISTDCHTGPREFLSDKNEPVSSLTDCLQAEYGILMPLMDAQSMALKLGDWTKQLTTIVQDSKMHDYYSKIGYDRVLRLSAERIMIQWYSMLEGLK